MTADPTPDTRQRTRDADRTQAEILLAARDEFADYGLGGARVDRIAERAKVNKRLIYYYFQNKESLFLAVLETAYDDIRAAERQLCLEELSPMDAVRKLTEFTWEYYIAHPEFLTLLNSENLHRARHLAKSDSVVNLNSPMIESLAGILERGRATGVFRGGIDPVQLYISIASLSYFYLSNTYTLSTAFGRDLLSPKAKAERISHINEVIMGYVLR